MRSALFTPGATTWFRVALVALAAGPLLLLGLGMAWVRSDYATRANAAVTQPILFDHRHHVVDDGIDCRYCHWGAWTSPYAGVPPASLCMNCHAQIWKDAPMLAPVIASARSDQPIPWVRVHRLPQFVFFNHSVHVGRGVSCESCHGRVDRMANVYPVHALTMSWCLGCHRHPERALRPIEAVAIMGWSAAPGSSDQTGAALVQTHHIDPPLSCSACHR